MRWNLSSTAGWCWRDALPGTGHMAADDEELPLGKQAHCPEKEYDAAALGRRPLGTSPACRAGFSGSHVVRYGPRWLGALLQLHFSSMPQSRCSVRP